MKRLREVRVLEVHLTFPRELLSLEWQSEAFSLEQSLIHSKVCVTLYGEPHGFTINVHESPSQYFRKPQGHCLKDQRDKGDVLSGLTVFGRWVCGGS